MMLRAIAIYKLDETSTTQPYVRTDHHEPSDAYKEFLISPLMFWQETTYLLKNLEKKSLPQLQLEDINSSRVVHVPCEGEHHYFRKIAKQPFLMTLCSKTRLSDIEAYYLLKNVENALLYPDSSRVTLQKIMRNNLEYTGRDHLPDAVRQDLDVLKQTLLDDINKMLERGEQLVDLQAVTLELCEVGYRFKREAEKQNSYCSGYC